MFQSDIIFQQLKDLENKLKAFKITDADSAAEYIKLYTELIYNYKNVGSLFDFYADNVVIHRENGDVIHGPHELVETSILFHAAFPDLTVSFTDYFAVKKGETYKVWRNYNLKGTNLGISKYGPASGKSLGDNCTVLSMATLENINNRWQITSEYVMMNQDLIKNTCTAERSE